MCINIVSKFTKTYFGTNSFNAYLIISAWWSWLSDAGWCDILDTHCGPVVYSRWYYYIFRIYRLCKISIVCPESDSRITNIGLLFCLWVYQEQKKTLYLISFYPCNFIVIAVCHLTLSWLTLGAGSWIQSTSMPLISIFWVSFWCVYLLVEIGF